ncbi:limonene-1,2-epoxide hydrolase family protein [Nocardia camponoti]|uniref:Limonene-1,2-epoxide hydrolase domain-containing protein n=1 Tax=Nocardia camponoti TaxID=1616106 RepID=A0A917V7M5_9NOCA|nr:limonene-1,2-epoxide hydrolase family protein [Nocardia camponoti]GGK48039.1 hypothetical protein GCM10011591_19260 [Nocardia camponoti]
MTDEPKLPDNDVTLVRQFFGALELGLVDEALDLLADDIVWKNTGLPTLSGKPQVAKVLRALNKPQFGFGVDIHHIAGHDGVVLTDRTDYLSVGPIRTGFWVSGTFHIANTHITLWDDHFSMGNFTAGVFKGIVNAIIKR